MNKKITVKGVYQQDSTKHVSTHWPQVCADHEEEFPLIHKCVEGTFNISMTKSSEYIRLSLKSKREGSGSRTI